MAGSTYAAGTVSEVIFGSGATSILNGGQLTVDGFGASGDVVAAGNGIEVLLAPIIVIGGQTFTQSQITRDFFDKFIVLLWN